MKFLSLKNLIVSLLVLFCIAAGAAYWLYNKAYAPNVNLDTNTAHIYVNSETDYNALLGDLDKSGYLKNVSSFKWTAEKMKLPQLLKPGKYELKHGMNNRELVSLLRLGIQLPVNLILKPIRSKEQIAALASTYLEPDSLAFLTLLNDNEYINELGYNSETMLSMFVPNTYQFNWNTSAEDFFGRMKKECDAFWTEEKLEKAKSIGLNKLQVSTMASIVEKETSKSDEKATVAGVYMNRLNKGMRLQADPTLIFALNDFEIRRVLNKHKLVDSPYNTYKHVGLPPGPICSPSISSINAVLDYDKHDFLFFCAKEDFSGYHNFAKTYSQHINNAKKFQRELDKRNIRS
ncbi:MAG: endolytic transglycosylase MltG [Bacteroidia bacterium]|nr:endolytic transglycosylase MltG [Bacteroidia bacterium]